MDIRPIRTDADHSAALTRIEALLDAPANTPEADELEILVTLVEAFEARHHDIPPPDPVDAILFRMEQLDMSRKDLEPLIGHSGRVAEVLNRKRGLSLAMIRRLHEALNIPLETLVRST
ncbi:MAG: transcriptional regulator [Gammaproteobacteria bacterium]|nr:MAG: transcriptional regulator [Gammaproteobacteria bacterium]